MTDNTILLGGNGSKQIVLNAGMANRHGLITGATGTGKTVTLQCLAEGFSDLGVPVFLADVKGDVSGISQPGSPNPKVQERAARIGIGDFNLRGYPVAFWDVFGQQGTPVRSLCVHPPYLEDISPLDPAWQQVPARHKGQQGTNRDVVEAVVFALTRPRHISLSSIVIDTDCGGLFD